MFRPREVKVAVTEGRASEVFFRNFLKRGSVGRTIDEGFENRIELAQ
jgi:hypothetical protein